MTHDNNGIVIVGTWFPDDDHVTCFDGLTHKVHRRSTDDWCELECGATAWLPGSLLTKNPVDCMGCMAGWLTGEMDAGFKENHDGQ